VARCLRLADVVADGRYKLYDDFAPPQRASAAADAAAQPRRTLGGYLAAVRVAVLAALEDRGGSDPFRVVKATS
jgi:nuclear pore complex protein Nup107